MSNNATNTNDPSMQKNNSNDLQQLVREGYNTISQGDNTYWQNSSKPDLGIYKDFKRLVKDQAEEKARILELGCGPGTTIGTDLIDAGFDYLGVDLSDANIARANQLFDGAEKHFELADMMEFTAEAEDDSFDGVVTMFADFHVPRGQRVQQYVNIMRILRPGGYLLFTCHPSSWEGYIEDYSGAKMYWSQFSHRWYDLTMRELGFKFIASFRNEYEKDHRENEIQYFMLFQKPEE